MAAELSEANSQGLDFFFLAMILLGSRKPSYENYTPTFTNSLSGHSLWQPEGRALKNSPVDCFSEGARRRVGHSKILKKMKRCLSRAERIKTVQWTVLAKEPGGAVAVRFISQLRK